MFSLLNPSRALLHVYLYFSHSLHKAIVSRKRNILRNTISLWWHQDSFSERDIKEVELNMHTDLNPQNLNFHFFQLLQNNCFPGLEKIFYKFLLSVFDHLTIKWSNTFLPIFDRFLDTSQYTVKAVFFSLYFTLRNAKKK